MQRQPSTLSINSGQHTTSIRRRSGAFRSPLLSGGVDPVSPSTCTGVLSPNVDSVSDLALKAEEAIVGGGFERFDSTSTDRIVLGDREKDLPPLPFSPAFSPDDNPLRTASSNDTCFKSGDGDGTGGSIVSSYSGEHAPEYALSPIPLTPRLDVRGSSDAAIPSGNEKLHKEDVSAAALAGSIATHLPSSAFDFTARPPASQARHSRRPSVDSETTFGFKGRMGREMERNARNLGTSLRSGISRGLSFISFKNPPSLALSGSGSGSGSGYGSYETERSRAGSFSGSSRNSASYFSARSSLGSMSRVSSADGKLRSVWSGSRGFSGFQSDLFRVSKKTGGSWHEWSSPLLFRTGTYPSSRSRHSLSSGSSRSFGALERGDLFGGIMVHRTRRWSKLKWALALSVITVLGCGGAGLVCATMTWFRAWNRSDVMVVADSDILILITLASSILLLSSLVGSIGTLLDSRPILAVYTLLLWPALIFLLAVGCTAYERSTFSLDQKLSLAWSQYYSPLGRLQIQDSLHCCGFIDVLNLPSPSEQCYPGSPLLGCKGELYRFEKANLETTWTAVFGLVPLHLANMLTALLSLNRVTDRFGERTMARRSRLGGSGVWVDVNGIREGMAERGFQPVGMPKASRAGSVAIFREDKERRVSSTSEKFGKKYLVDRNPETCWQSDSKLPQHIEVLFTSAVLPKRLSVTFQGGFTGTQTTIDIRKNSGEWVNLTSIYPEDVNRKQTFDLPTASGVEALKLTFEKSSDFFGRIVVYDLRIEGIVL